ncbi:putative mannosyltransferase [Aspergillus nomiae NRRL 13137]|uniref:Mannosyltransferase n=1 Tax=Aspergillus nomiae NRRL (strain ATCC 15546 / NRRL 13137 / CBS 260.88 / M93) TaxID=1509407 RepID=A0A0L1J427_ASPN3|nr:putative mannosyltransferase [Aspergillus nomiae NRRL 13137]KNG86193.1 putative mannosyltransferase [Aspergillus nomiae NRRL 13137]
MSTSSRRRRSPLERSSSRSSSSASLSSSSYASWASTTSPPSRLRPPPPSSSSSTSTSTSTSSSRARTTTVSTSHVFLFLVAFRLLNALSLRTFFQPDEFFQSLEPAWQTAFGETHGAWITWEWRHHLRSSIHPLLFATVYSIADLGARVLRLSPAFRADLLIVAPKVAQAVLSAIGDLYTWKLARYVYGRRSDEAWAALALTVLSPWQWFCSTRTLSNCLETTITIVALNLWPWEWSSESTPPVQPRRNTRSTARDNGAIDTGDGAFIVRLRKCLTLAAFACILRPTNILIWMGLAGVAWFRSAWRERTILCREVLLCGVTVLTGSVVLDRLYYGLWTFPPLRFLYFNISQSLAVYYGRNDWHYYATQGYPLLLTTALPFTLVGLYRTLTQSRSTTANTQHASVQTQLAAICLFMPLVLSLISHKEVRFIYPLLPTLHVLTAPPLVDFFLPAVSHSSGAYMPRRLSLVFLLLVNVTIAIYTSVYHASGAINVLSYLRDQQQAHTTVGNSPYSPGASQRITAGFLMPCHSTPWRSHLVDPNIHAWALSCEPPVDLNEAQKAVYVDEADQFYNDPSQFLRNNMVGGLRHLPRKPSYLASSKPRETSPQAYQQATPHEWPDYLIFFAPLEPTLHSLLRSSSYGECWRTWNTAWHDDSRRRGDIIVWCLDPTEQAAWRSATRKRTLEHRDRQFDRIVETFRKNAPGQRKSSPWTRWISSLSGQSASSSWSWPWEQRRRTWLGIQLPVWKKSSWNLPSWTLPKSSKKKTRAVDRDLWS